MLKCPLTVQGETCYSPTRARRAIRVTREAEGALRMRTAFCSVLAMVATLGLGESRS